MKHDRRSFVTFSRRRTDRTTKKPNEQGPPRFDLGLSRCLFANRLLRSGQVPRTFATSIDTSDNRDAARTSHRRFAADLYQVSDRLWSITCPVTS